MSEARNQVWSLKEFLAWEDGQERRYEFVGGQARLMAGGSQAYALIAANVVSSLHPLLRGSGCRSVGSDLRVVIPETSNVRYPDVTIDCGRFNPSSQDASEPTVIFEILSQSTGWYDQTRKLKDYEALSSVDQYICVSQSEARVSVWLRDAERRFVAQDDITHLARAVTLTVGSVTLQLSDIYEGLTFAKTDPVSEDTLRGA